MIVRDPARALPTINATYPYGYGLTYGVNKKALEFCQCGTAEKQVTFPEAGTYRLDFSSRARVWIYAMPDMGYAGNQLAFYLVDGNNATNEFYRSPSICSTNFVFRSALFNVPAAGTYTFGIKGLNGWPMEDGSHLRVGNNADDSLAFIDQVIIEKADETRKPDIPETLALELADGARLRLDFAGTNRIDRLRLNGTPVADRLSGSAPEGHGDNVQVVATGKMPVVPVKRQECRFPVVAAKMAAPHAGGASFCSTAFSFFQFPSP